MRKTLTKVFSRIFSQNITEIIKQENIRLYVPDEFVIIMWQNPLKVDSSDLIVTFRRRNTSTPPQVQLGPDLVSHTLYSQTLSRALLFKLTSNQASCHKCDEG